MISSLKKIEQQNLTEIVINYFSIYLGIYFFWILTSFGWRIIPHSLSWQELCRRERSRQPHGREAISSVSAIVFQLIPTHSNHFRMILWLFPIAHGPGV